MRTTFPLPNLEFYKVRANEQVERLTECMVSSGTTWGSDKLGSWEDVSKRLKM